MVLDGSLLGSLLRGPFSRPLACPSSPLVGDPISRVSMAEDAHDTLDESLDHVSHPDTLAPVGSVRNFAVRNSVVGVLACLKKRNF